jgi:hypothetical protein
MNQNDEAPLADGWNDEILFQLVLVVADEYEKVKGNPDDVRWVAGFGAAMYFVATLIPKDVFDTYAYDVFESLE